MKQAFSNNWKSSTQPRKQRKYAAQAPLHVKSSMLSSHLSKALREKYGKRSIRVRKGDKVKVLVGNFKGKTGKVESVITKDYKVHIEGVDSTKKDGSKIKYPVHVSNIMITELNLDDKKRKSKLEGNVSKKTDKTESAKKD